MIIGLSVLACIGGNIIPASIVAKMPLLFSHIFGSAIVGGALASIILNLVLPKGEEVADFAAGFEDDTLHKEEPVT